MENLVSLNLSNNFSGYLPNTKLFRQIPASNLAGNEDLCTQGGDVCFIGVNSDEQPITAQEETRRLRKLKLAIALLITLTVAMILGMIGVIKARKMGGRKCDSDSEIGGDMAWPWQFTTFQKLTFSVEHVVGSLIDANVICKGCSGVVYRVNMDNEDPIAVKKLWPNTTVKEDGAEIFLGGGADAWLDTLQEHCAISWVLLESEHAVTHV